MMFQITAMQIRELPPAATQADFNIVIQSHRNTLECATKLQKVMHLALMMQLTFCIAIWCLMLFYILFMGFSSKILNVSLLLLILTYETYSYCQLGTHFTETADEVLSALQQLTWYDQPVSIQKQIYFMIQHSQRSIVLKAGKLFPVNIAQFSELVKKSYSLYLVLKDVF
ncbi:putative odorant receptor 83c [Anopheles maculipalpis]|uniref:putative odorant receptor 83c n=1 Tax=Anopheles maculipalpis TaxID=1496333 RepID=UPI002158E206|nr:putative odorant receptor 83c [Anopheles maculipalpis]